MYFQHMNEVNSFSHQLYNNLFGSLKAGSNYKAWWLFSLLLSHACLFLNFMLLSIL